MKTWKRVDGALLGWDDERPLSDFTDYLERHRILAVVDGEGGDVVALRFLVDDEERVATSHGDSLSSGIDLEDLIADIGAAFQVEAEAGGYSNADIGEPGATVREDELEGIEGIGLDDDVLDGAFEHGCGEDGCACSQGAGIRAVTLLDGGVSEVAAVARELGEPIVVLPLAGRSAVLTEEGDSLPLTGDTTSVQLLSLDGRAALIVESGDVMASVSWGVPRTLTPSECDGAAAQALTELARDEELADVVAELGGQSEQISAAIDPVDGGPQALLEVLDVPGPVWEFLVGERAAHEVADVVVITPPTTRETLSYLVDDVVQEARIASRLDQYEREHPVATRAPSASAILIGTGLAAFGAVKTTGVVRAALIGAGGFIAANGLAGLSITEVLRSSRPSRSAHNW